MLPKPMELELANELGKRIEELVCFAQSHYIAAPDLLWNFSACVVANMHGEIRQAMLTRIMVPLDGEIE